MNSVELKFSDFEISRKKLVYEVIENNSYTKLLIYKVIVRNNVRSLILIEELHRFINGWSSSIIDYDEEFI